MGWAAGWAAGWAVNRSVRPHTTHLPHQCGTASRNAVASAEGIALRTCGQRGKPGRRWPSPQRAQERGAHHRGWLAVGWMQGECGGMEARGNCGNDWRAWRFEAWQAPQALKVSLPFLSCPHASTFFRTTTHERSFRVWRAQRKGSPAAGNGRGLSKLEKPIKLSNGPPPADDASIWKDG